jgi:hypothetical protein
MKKPSDKLRDMEHPTVLGYELDRESLTPIQLGLQLSPGDYGADPVGEVDGVFKWRMVPSGDLVDYHERLRRLKGRGLVRLW